MTSTAPQRSGPPQEGPAAAPIRVTGSGVEPELTLPTVGLLLTQLTCGVLMAAAWAGLGILLGNVEFHAASGVAGAGAVTIAAWVTTLLGVPWMPKAASTALLAWLGCTMLRMLASPALLVLLYSAPFAGGRPAVIEQLAAAKASALMALATTFLLGLLVEVGVIARHLRRTERLGPVAPDRPQP